MLFILVVTQATRLNLKWRYFIVKYWYLFWIVRKD